jgi:hypothetical protein
LAGLLGNARKENAVSNLNISVDMGRVQSSVQAAIRPAVETALAGVDVKQIIVDALTKKPPKSERDDIYGMIYGARSETRTLVRQFVDEGIAEIAKEYVQRELRAQQPYIEEGLRKALVASGSKLAKSFGQAIERAMKEDWGFAIAVKATHTLAGKDSDDD